MPFSHDIAVPAKALQTQLPWQRLCWLCFHHGQKPNWHRKLLLALEPSLGLIFRKSCVHVPTAAPSHNSQPFLPLSNPQSCPCCPHLVHAAWSPSSFISSFSQLALFFFSAQIFHSLLTESLERFQLFQEMHTKHKSLHHHITCLIFICMYLFKIPLSQSQSDHRPNPNYLPVFNYQIARVVLLKTIIKNWRIICYYITLWSLISSVKALKWNKSNNIHFWCQLEINSLGKKHLVFSLWGCQYLLKVRGFIAQ